MMVIQLSTEVERLARLLATKTGKSLDEIIKEAIEERARAAGVAVGVSGRSAAEIGHSLNEIVARMSALPILDNRAADEIIGYDEFGVPR
jgi:antitoxin VapB